MAIYGFAKFIEDPSLLIKLLIKNSSLAFN